jgi:hypothetical protein
MSGTEFISIGGAYDKAFQQQLLLHLVYCDNLLKLAASCLKPADFEIPVQRLVCEALLDYYGTFQCRPNMEMLKLQLLKVVQNSERKYTSSITPEEGEALAYLLTFLSHPGALSEDRFIAELGPYLNWIRGSRLVTQCQSQGGNMAELTKKLVDLDRQLSFLGGKPVQHRLSERPALIMRDEDAPTCISTGLSGFDVHLDGGIRKHELGMLTACPGVGKTNSLIHLALMGTLSVFRVLYVTLELEFEKIARRYLAMGAGVPARYTKKPVPMWPEEHQRRMSMFMDKSFGAYDRLTICDLAGKTSPVQRLDKEIDNWLLTTEKTFGNCDDCALVCVDWADKWSLPGVGKEVPEHIRLTRIMEEMDHISHRYPVGIWTATQGTREADNRSVLMMSDAAGAYHKNDSLDIGVGVGVAPEDKVKFEQALSGNAYGRPKTQLPAELRMIWTINKNREGSQAVLNVFRAETLRLYNSPLEYQQHMHNITNASNPALLWGASKLQPVGV